MTAEKQTTLIKVWFPIVSTCLFLLCGALYAQQNRITEKQGVLIGENHEEQKGLLAKKVDNKVLMQMIKVIEIRQEVGALYRKKQDNINERVLDNLQELNENVILLNERMKIAWPTPGSSRY